jgi:rhodanese-related sulfurtransferase
METQQLIIDVREADEFKTEKVPGSLHLPLSQLDLVAPGILTPLKNCSITIMCRSGGRASMAYEKLKAMQLIDPSKTQVYQGGILEWKKQGKPTEGRATRVLPIMRQVQLGAGLLILTGSLLTIFMSSQWIYLPLFVGAGLTVAGSTGFCGMALLLQKMPWNRVKEAPLASCARN